MSRSKDADPLLVPRVLSFQKAPSYESAFQTVPGLTNSLREFVAFFQGKGAALGITVDLNSDILMLLHSFLMCFLRFVGSGMVLCPRLAKLL